MKYEFFLKIFLQISCKFAQINCFYLIIQPYCDSECFFSSSPLHQMDGGHGVKSPTLSLGLIGIQCLSYGCFSRADVCCQGELDTGLYGERQAF